MGNFDSLGGIPGRGGVGWKEINSTVGDRATIFLKIEILVLFSDRNFAIKWE